MRTTINRLNPGILLALRLVVSGCGGLTVTNIASATVRYVDVNSASPTPPFTTWATAAANIQDAVDAAVAGDEIVVTNGVYQPVVVYKPLTLRSVTGPELTVVDGEQQGASCVYLTNGALLVGFTLTNGYAHEGGGV